MTFQIGQKVICIDGTPPSAENGSDYCPIRPVKGEMYTIRGIHTEPHIEGYGVYLEECLNPSTIWSDGHEAEWPFASTRFKPIQEWGIQILERAIRQADEAAALSNGDR
jgi:hypothetical protein